MHIHGCTNFLPLLPLLNAQMIKHVFFFGIHLLKDSYTWFSNLPDNIAKNCDKLKEQFIARFGLNGATKWSVLPEIYDMKQRTDQPVEDFIQKVQMKSKCTELPEDQAIGALMKGFLPQIRSDLIRADIIIMQM